VIVNVINTTITQDQAIKFEHRTSGTQSLITGILFDTDSAKIEASMYQENRSKAVFRKMEFGQSVEIDGYTIHQKKGFHPLNVSGHGNYITGVIKGLSIEGTGHVAIYLKIDE